MKKKLSLILCLCFMVLGFAACGEDPRTVDYFGMTYDELQNLADQNVNALAMMSDEQKEQQKSYQSEALVNLIDSWDEVTADLGGFQNTGEFLITKTQDTVTAEQRAEFSDREVVVTFVYKYDYETEQLNLVDATADLNYTLGEKMTKAGLNTLMGMGTVFAVLILISLIIYCFRYISVVQVKMSGKKTEEKKEPAAVVTQIEQREEQQQLTDDLELVAVIAAAVAADAGVPADSFVVRSIRRR